MPTFYSDSFPNFTYPKAIVGGALCQIGLFVLAFGKKVWDKNENALIEELSKSTIEAVKKMFSRRIFLHEYNKVILQLYHLVNHIDFGNINAIKLEHIFVELSVDAANIVRNDMFGAKTEQLAGNHSIWYFIKKSAAAEYDGIAWAVIGAAGSGKTSLVQNIAITLAAGRENSSNMKKIPVVIFLREHIESIMEGISFDKLLETYFADDNKFPTLKAPQNWFKDNLADGKFIVMLDGLDEIADLGKRRIAAEWIDKQVATYSQSRFIVTARPQGYRDARLKNVRVLKINSFSNEQMRKFINNWYLLQLLNEIIEDKSIAKQKAANLIEILSNSAPLKGISDNPLLLTMIAIVHDYHGALPGSRNELYRELCKVMLDEDRKKAGEKSKNTEGLEDIERSRREKRERQLRILRQLARHMMEDESRSASISFKDLEKQVGKLLKDEGLTDVEPEKFIDELELKSGLLIEKEHDRWGFVHLSFQEYLTAEYWLKNKSVRPKWNTLVDESWWQETLRFYVTDKESRSGAVVDACEKSNSTQALTLLTAIQSDHYREKDKTNISH